MSPEFYRASLDGQPCLRMSGRFRRLALPVLPSPPDDPTEKCFLCRPSEDPLYLRAWGKSGLEIVGNAHPVGSRSFLVAPAGLAHHNLTPSHLPKEILGELISIPFSRQFLAWGELDSLDVACFLNHGTFAAQSRRHPHLQIVGFDRALDLVGKRDRSELCDELGTAASDGRSFDVGSLSLVIPKRPGSTFEAWLCLGKHCFEKIGAALARCLDACERCISGNYNLVVDVQVNIVRIIPRGLSERGGVEIACGDRVSAVVTASVEESLFVWSRALSRTTS